MYRNGASVQATAPGKPLNFPRGQAVHAEAPVEMLLSTAQCPIVRRQLPLKVMIASSDSRHTIHPSTASTSKHAFALEKNPELQSGQEEPMKRCLSKRLAEMTWACDNEFLIQKQRRLTQCVCVTTLFLRMTEPADTRLPS